MKPKKRIRFSIIIPNYNGGMFIKETLKSIINQKGNFEIEIIIFDALSNDNSIEIIKEIGEKINKLNHWRRKNKIIYKYKCEKDEGQADAINKGIKSASGDIIAYINSDDTYNRYAFQSVLNSYEKDKKTWYYGKGYIITEGGVRTKKLLTSYRDFHLPKMTKRMLYIENTFIQPSVFWSKQSINQIGLFDKGLFYCMDYDYLIRSFKNSQPRFIDRYLSNFRWVKNRKSSDYYNHAKEHHLVTQKYCKNKVFLFLSKLNLYKKILGFKIMDKIK